MDIHIFSYKKIFSVLMYGSAILIFIVALLLLLLRFSFPGGWKFYSVLSGSMQPAIPVGSVILTHIPEQERDLQIGDIITFEQPGFTGRYITHRIHSIEEQGASRNFVTKGDANDTSDDVRVVFGRVKGVYVTHLPYVGSWLEFIRKPLGIAMFIVLPTLIIIVKEINSLINLIVERRVQKILQEIKDSEVKTKSNIPVGLVLLVVIGSATPSAFAQFTSNSVFLASTSISVGTLVTSPSPNISPSPVPSVSPSPTPIPTDACDMDIDVHAENTNTGPGSTNINNFFIRNVCKREVVSETTINNLINISTDIGNNNSESNTNGGNIQTGNVHFEISSQVNTH